MPEEEPQAEQQSTKGGRKKWIIIGAAALILIIASVLGAWAAGLLPGSGAATEEATIEEVAGDVNEVVNLEPIVVNVSSTRKMAYARIGLSLGLHNTEPGRPVLNIELVLPRIKDELLSTVGQMSMEELLLPETKQALKEQVQAFVNGLIEPGSGRVVEVYITDFVVQ